MGGALNRERERGPRQGRKKSLDFCNHDTPCARRHASPWKRISVIVMMCAVCNLMMAVLFMFWPSGQAVAI